VLSSCLNLKLSRGPCCIFLTKLTHPFPSN
jgi:hypothetical protein